METLTTDVLIIGGGAAGIRAALAAGETGATVLLLGKGPVAASGATFCPVSKGWGIQGLVGNERTGPALEGFYQDIIRVGLGEGDPVLARVLVEESGTRIQDLIAFGIQFSRDATGRYVRVKGCFSEENRAFLAHNSLNIRNAFLTALERAPVRTLTGYAIDLITDQEACRGVDAILPSGQFLRIHSRATVLATGGGGGIYEYNLVGDGQIGDGYALAHGAGARLSHMEFIQFMLGARSGQTDPFVPFNPCRPGTIHGDDDRDLLESAVPDPDARSAALRERRRHAPFSCRDISSRVDIGIGRALMKGKRPLWREAPGQGHMTLHHFAHAFNGGVSIDLEGRTTVKGLYACGEAAAGPHGADRIGGCMMTATQVFGYRAGRAAGRHALMIRRTAFPRTKAPDLTRYPRSTPPCVRGEIKALKTRLRRVMGRHAMVVRDKNGLTACGSFLNDCQVRLEEIRETKRLSSLSYYELRNMIITSQLVVAGAVARKESRGSHYREDFPIASGA